MPVGTFLEPGPMSFTTTTTRALWIAGTAIVVFSTGLNHGFVYDDSWTVVNNRWLDHPLPELLGLLATGDALAKGIPDATRPAMVLSLWVDRQLFGRSPAGYHLTSLLWYGVSCALAALVIMRTTRKREVATIAAVFFAICPLHAEPVAAINYREDLLSAAGVLAAWLLLLGPFPGTNHGNTWARAACAAGAWLAALAAKESAIALVPLAAATLLLLPHERAAIRSRSRVIVALMATGLVWVAWRASLSARGDDIPLAPDRGITDASLRSARFVVHSLRQAILPIDWAPDHWRQPDAGAVWLFLLALIIVAIVIVARAPTRRPLAFGLAIALVAPIPASPIFRPVNELADRYFFLGVMGGGILWGVILNWAAERLRLSKPRRQLLALACFPLLLPTLQAIEIWRDERSLWSAAVERTPNSPRAWAALSRVHRHAGDHDAARRAVERAIEIDPGYPASLVTRVYNEIAAGELASARRHLDDLEQRKLGDYRGVRRARRCASLEPQSARRCLGP